MQLNEEIQNKWKPVIEHPELAAITDSHKRAVTAQVLENTERALREAAYQSRGSQSLFEAGNPTNAMGTSEAGTGAVDVFDPVLISLVRRAMPNLIAYDICGVQPMTGPTGLIFAMRSRYTNQSGDEAFYNESNTAFSAYDAGGAQLGNNHLGSLGAGANLTALATNTEINYAGGENTQTLERYGNGTVTFPQMAFSIEKVTVTAKGRALKAEYSMELAQDLRAVHGLDAESELSNILSAEILSEINREVIRSIYVTSKVGASSGTTAPGVFDLDTDSNGRWSVEKFKGLMFQVEREANVIAKETRRGKGNIIICSSDVASALQMAGVLDYAPALNNNNLQIDDTGNTFAGVLNGRIKVYIDPYAGGNYMVVGYKGSNAFDAGIFYCPYVPLQMVRAVDPDTFQPKIGFKTRYGMVANPFNDGSAAAGTGALTQDTNVYYRRVRVNNIM